MKIILKNENEIRILWDYYIVHIHLDTPDNYKLNFKVYPVDIWEQSSTGKTGVSYIEKRNEPHILEKFEEDKCLKKLEGSVWWRGAWDNRLYFPDDEYWDDELAEFSTLYYDYILPWCTNFIKECNPHQYYD